MYGGITEEGKSYFLVRDATSIAGFRAFLEHLKDNDVVLADLVFVMDNHSSQRSNTVKDLVASEGAKIEFVPPYSS